MVEKIQCTLILSNKIKKAHIDPIGDLNIANYTPHDLLIIYEKHHVPYITIRSLEKPEQEKT